MIRRNSLIANIDWITIFLWIILVAFGWMNIYSANIMNGDGTIFDFTQRYGKQFIWIGTSIILIAIVFILDAKIFALVAYPLYGLIMLTLIVVLVFGKEINGARSWFVLGGFQFQPSEFAKPFTALALARLLSSHGFNLKKMSSLILALTIGLAPAALIMLQPDMGSTLVYFAFIFVLYREGFSQNTMIFGGLLVVLFIMTLLIEKSFVILAIWLVSLFLFSKNSTSKNIFYYLFLPGLLIFTTLLGINIIFELDKSTYLISLITIAATAITTAIISLKNRSTRMFKNLTGMVVAVIFVFSVDYAMNEIIPEHQKTRILVTLGLEDDPQGAGYNVNQSKIAIGSGGFSGKGFLNGTQTKLQFVPEQSTDFIFCTIGEEWGFLGTSAVVILMVILILRLIKLAERQRSEFSRIYGYGLISVLIIHFVVNIGMTIGLMPVIGIPLPFFSYGGSSMLAFTLFLFIFLKLDSNRLELLR